jgi:hypothetical protein
MRLMYDAADPSKIPDGSFVAGYVNGAYAWSAEEWSAFGQQLGIDVTGSAPLMSNILDVEPGNLGTPDGDTAAAWALLVPRAVAWARQRQERNLSVTLYVEASRFVQLSGGLADAGVKGVRYWVADWGITQSQAEGKVGGVIAGIQFQGGQDAPYDLSVVADDWFPVKPDPKPPVVLTGLTLTGHYSDSTSRTLWLGPA